MNYQQNLLKRYNSFSRQKGKNKNVKAMNKSIINYTLNLKPSNIRLVKESQRYQQQQKKNYKTRKLSNFNLNFKNFRLIKKIQERPQKQGSSIDKPKIYMEFQKKNSNFVLQKNNNTINIHSKIRQKLFSLNSISEYNSESNPISKIKLKKKDSFKITGQNLVKSFIKIKKKQIFQSFNYQKIQSRLKAFSKKYRKKQHNNMASQILINPWETQDKENIFIFQ